MKMSNHEKERRAEGIHEDPGQETGENAVWSCEESPVIHWGPGILWWRTIKKAFISAKISRAQSMSFR